MKFIKPITITDSNLNSSTVYETPPATYNSGTTYTIGNAVSTGTTGGVIYVWVSLQDDNTGHDPATSPTWWSLVNTTYAVYNAGTTYALGDKVIRTETHKVYESLQAANTGNTPETSVTWWLQISETNKWAMFDKSVGTSTTCASPLQVVFTPNSLYDAIGLLDVSGATNINIKMVNGAETVYDRDFDMTDDSEILDWYMYFFQPFLPKSDLIVDDLPPYPSATITVTIEGLNTVSCGTLSLGSLVQIGNTRYGANISIVDYSIKEVDEFGVTNVVERTYAKRLDASVEIKNSAIDFITKNLTAVRTVPVVWVADNGTNLASSLIVYGFYKDWSIDVAYFDDSVASLTIEGLT